MGFSGLPSGVSFLLNGNQLQEIRNNEKESEKNKNLVFFIK
jgi:hypothetical protein